MLMLMLMMILMLMLMMLMIHLWHYFGVSTVERKGEECVDENADKLDHLESGQIPER